MEERNNTQSNIHYQHVPQERESFFEIRTKRLYLREITEQDAQTIVEMRNNPHVYRFFRAPHAITLEEHLHWYRMKYLMQADRFDWIAFLESQPVGVFALSKQTSCTRAEVNYLIRSDNWGNGYAQEAVAALLEWAKTVWGVSVVCAVIHCDNTASIRFAERMGFQKKDANGCFFSYEKNINSSMTKQENCLNMNEDDQCIQTNNVLKNELKSMLNRGVTLNPYSCAQAAEFVRGLAA